MRQAFYKVIAPQFEGDVWFLVQDYGFHSTAIAKRATQKEILELKRQYEKRDREMNF